MLHYILMPMDEHYDGGIGYMGLSFFDAAKRLDEPASPHPLPWNHLPVQFLLRHASELFLKSIIICLNRRFGALQSIADLSIQGSSEKPKRIWDVHSLEKLIGHLKSDLDRFSPQLSTLQTRLPLNWNLSDELLANISIIDNADASGTHFRYPAFDPERDANKSAFKRVDDLPFEEDAKVMALLLEDQDGNLKGIYRAEHNTDQPLLKAVRDAAQELGDWHATVRAEVTGGR